jgi:flagellar biosynthetic protein FlhB
MADEGNSQEKTEEPTPRRIEEARKKGQVARSQELSSVAIIMAGLIALMVMSPMMLHQLKSVMVASFGEAGKIPVGVNSIRYIFHTYGLGFAKILAPFLLVLALVGFFTAYLQVGPLFTFQVLEPKFDKLNIVKGLKQVISTRKLFELSRDLLKISIIGVVAYVTVKNGLHDSIELMDQSLGQILVFGSKMVFKVGIYCALALLVLAILDFAYQRYTYQKGLRMTKQEIKDEFKQYEGDPLIKSRIRRIQKEQARRRMLQDVKKADVVVTNPTELAVALEYDNEKMNAPVVLAKGQRLLAAKIKEFAKKYEIPIVEDKPLAQALYKFAEVGMEIPENLYKAVAEVLAYVYRLKNKAMN